MSLCGIRLLRDEQCLAGRRQSSKILYGCLRLVEQCKIAHVFISSVDRRIRYRYRRGISSRTNLRILLFMEKDLELQQLCSDVAKLVFVFVGKPQHIVQLTVITMGM